VVLGLRGRRNLDGGEEPVADEHRAALRRRSARLIALTVLIVGLAAVALFLQGFLAEKGSPALPT
jgi:hypothetical protein